MNRQQEKLHDSKLNMNKISRNKVARTIQRMMDRGETYRAIMLAHKYRNCFSSPQFDRITHFEEI
jgi:hypothetical protein